MRRRMIMDGNKLQEIIDVELSTTIPVVISAEWYGGFKGSREEPYEPAGWVLDSADFQPALPQIRNLVYEAAEKYLDEVNEDV